MNAIEKVLFEKTKDFQEGQIYSDQWKFAKSYLPKVLDTISHIFPHYSLHNSTHSEAIINNIVRILGTDNIEKLPVVDLWLLLAASYYHDCGMVVTGNDKKILFNDGSEFVRYLEEKQHDIASPLNQYAILFEIKDDKIYYKNEQLTQESYEGARFLLADYIRNHHAERSEERIEKEESLHFPGDPIPERIIRILKTICSCHTKDVEEVMNLQPVESSGCGTEDCHPRFVAAMLRLGDLLDVDSNRVSEVLLSTLGSIPSDSKYYNNTNRSITHIRIDQSVVEITAECNDYHVADLINRWFQWLNDEIVFYMKRWHIIIPFEDFGYLPTVGDLKVNLSGYDTFDGKKRPGFEIDTSKAIELLQGSGLYTDSCECIRELLQNAVDATYLRVYKENPGIKDLNNFKKKCEEYPIVVKLDKIKNAGVKDEDVCWKIRIEDQGIGMTKDDLRFLSKTGSSGGNLEKQRLIRSVPELLWPSGTFGIGFQSVFLITNKVSVETRKINKDYYIRAEMHNPSGKEKGAILIQSIEKEDVRYGTTLSFEFYDKSSGHQLINSYDRYSYSELSSFDFAKNKSVNLVGMKVMDEVVRFANGTFIPVDFILDGDKKKYVSQKTKIKFGEVDEETGMQVFIDKINPLVKTEVESCLYFRNQLVRDYYLNLPFLSFHINVLKGNAKDLLTLNRNNVRQEYNHILRTNIKKTIVKYLNKKIDSYDATRRQYAAMCLELYKDFIKDNGIESVKYRNYWEKYELTLKKEGTEETVHMSLDMLLTSESIERIYRDTEMDLMVVVKEGIRYIVVLDFDMWLWIYEFVLQKAQEKDYSLCFKKDGLALLKEKCDVIEDTAEAREDIMYRYLRMGERARGLFPCSDKYSMLRINKQTFEKWDDLYVSFDYSCMICPYIRIFDAEQFDEPIGLEYDVDDKVIKTVYDNRIDQSVTRDQIKKAYNDFKEEWMPIIEKVNVRIKKEPHYSYGRHRYSIMV